MTCFLCLYVFGCDFSSCLCVVWNFASKLRNLPTFTDIIINNSPLSSVEKGCSNENAKVPVLSCEYTAMLFLPKISAKKTNKSDSVGIIKNDQVVLKRYSVSLCAIKCCFNNARCNFSIALVSCSFLLVFPKLQLHFLVSQSCHAELTQHRK